VQPNQISVAGVLFAGAAGAALLASTATGPELGPYQRGGLLLVAAAGIQLRLLCNLLDGMVAVEGGRKTKGGEVFNELPDRASDGVLLVCAGYASAAAVGPAWAAALGWAAACLAGLTAYVRAFGASLGTGQDYRGPMAKQQRMAVLTGACLLGMLQPWTASGAWAAGALAVALAVIVAGSAVTVARRTRRIVAELEAR
jgi:phosphatidylglycerophosphate synthase